MPELGTEIASYLEALGPDAARRMRIAAYRDAFEAAVRFVWRHDALAADYVLAHVNGFYIHKDDRPRKRAFRDRDHILCTIYADDATIRSDIDARQELLRLVLARENVHYDELRILPSKLDMRTRRPFPEAVRRLERAMRGEDVDVLGAGAGANLATRPSDEVVECAVALIDDPLLAGKVREAMTALPVDADGSRQPAAARSCREARDLQDLKRAFCQVFGEDAEDLLSLVNGAALEPVRWSRAEQKREGRQRYWCHLYADDPRLLRAVAEHGDELRAHTRDLGLLIQAIQLHEPFDAIRGAHAFPRAGYPVPLGAMRAEQS